MYLDETGKRIEDPEALERLRGLAVPPAWADVWICPDPFGHLQATGIDAAGRKQYLYHERWRARRDEEKFERMLRFARLLPKLRSQLASEIGESGDPTRERVLACAVRLLDVGLFRVGGEEYAEDESGVGLATLRKEHACVEADAIVFDYPAKGGVRRIHVITDPLSYELVRTLRRRRSGPDELLAYRNGRHWRDVRANDINQYLKDAIGDEFSAKDFRTWNASVLAAVSLGAGEGKASSERGRKRHVNNAVRAVAELLGNTPAVARRAYIDPRVFDRYLSGWTIAPALEKIGDLDSADDAVREQVERAVLDLLGSDPA